MVADDSFRGWLKQRRKWLDLTQGELAEKAGCSLSTVRRLEQGGLRPSRQLAELLAIALELAPDERPPFVRWARVGGVATEPGPAPAAPVQSTPNGDAPYTGSAEPPNPYKGLRAFQEADAADFFGREALVQRLLARLGEESELSRFLALVGPSGGGKSSLARAGLVPALRQQALPGGAQPVIANISPGTHPLEELEAGLLRVAINPPGSLMEQLRADERGLARAVKRVLPGDEKRELVLVIDQFEELFTLVADERVRADFIDSLFAAISDPRSRLWVVVTLRADFYDRPLLYRPSTELLNRRSELIGPLSSEEMYRAIAVPAERAGLALESGLVAAILGDVADQPGSLPLLQYALTELYERRAGHLLTRAAYQASGGVFGALAGRAESLYGGLIGLEQAEARQVFLRLVTPGEGADDMRRRVLRSELASAARDEDALQRVLEQFGRYRLLTFDRHPLNGEPTVEVAHEALFRTWGRLRAWLSESRERLALQRQLMRSAAEWRAAEQEGSFLARGARLTQFARLADEADQPGALVLTGEERTYLAASQAEQQRNETAERARIEREQTNEQRVRSSEQIARDNLARASALRLAAEANSLLLAHGDTNLIALLSIRSLHSAYSPQGDAALSGAAILGFPPRRLTGHRGYVQTVVFSPDDHYLATASEDSTARLWDFATGQQIRLFAGHAAGLQDIRFSPDGKYLFTTSRDQTARQWDIATGQQIRLFSGHTDMVTGVAVSPDGNYLLTAGEDGTARLWDIATAQTVRIFTNREGALSTVAISPDGKYVLTGGAGNTPQLWDLASGELLRTFAGHTGFINVLAFSPDGTHMVSGAEDHTVRIWDVTSGRQLGIFAGHKGWVRAVIFTSDGKYVLSSSNDSTVQLWDVRTLQTRQVFGGQTGWVLGVACSADSKYAAISSADYSIGIWSLQAAPGEMQFIGHTGPVEFATFSPDNQQVVTGSADGTVRTWDTASGHEMFKYTGLVDGEDSPILWTDGERVLRSGAGGSAVLMLWDAATGREVRRFAGHTAKIRGAAFSPDRQYLVTTSDDGTARTWDVPTGQSLVVYHGPRPGHINRVVFSPDAKTVVTSGDDGTARLWEPLTGQEIRVFRGHAGIVSGAAFSPEGHYLVTTGFDGSVRLWELSSGREVRRLAGHPGGAYGAAFSPDGKYVVTGGADHTARLWDVQTGAEVRRFSGHSNTVRDVVFSPDGQFILTASHDNTARLWHTDYHDTIAYVCGLLSRDLTPDERSEYGIIDQQPTCTPR